IGDKYIEARNEKERLLALIWGEVLGLERVGIRDNFFELGGDSMRSIQVLAQAQQHGLNFTLQQLFQHSTIEKLAQEIDQIQSYKEEQIAMVSFSLISEEDRRKLKDDVEDAYPLSKMQAGLVFHSEYSPEASIYHAIEIFYLEARFDLELLERSIKQLIARHPILRTSFDLVHFSEPLQLVHRSASVHITVNDLSNLSQQQQREAIMAKIIDERDQTFDYTKPPLIRILINLCADNRFQVILSFHHAILDGWSVASLVTELLQRYKSLLSNNEMPIEKLGCSFRDFVTLEREALASNETRDYWTQKLSDASVTKLPRLFDSDKAQGNYQFGKHSLLLPEETTRSLKQLALMAGIPLKSVLLAAHIKVISFASGQTDILTGVALHGRPETADGEQILGLFLNMLPFRQRLSGGSWLDLVQEVFTIEREMLPYRRYPMAQIQLDMGSNLLFETVFNFVHFHVYRGVQKLDDVQLLGVGGLDQTNFTLLVNFMLDQTESFLGLGLNCNLNDISQNQLETIAHYYENTLMAMIKDPSARYQYSCLLTQSEQYQMLTVWNDTVKVYPADKCIHQIFEQQVSYTPDAIALIYRQEPLTYQELNRLANQLAHYLCSQGVGAEVVVGIYLERSIEMVVAMLGILKAGGAYLPLDIDYPRERIGIILSEADTSIVI
ncbi:MAG: condensation domain-containing protein, partial [Acidobacteriota bacterium]